jgi:hypothetical protein
MWSLLPVLFAWGALHTMLDCVFWYWATLWCATLAAVEFITSLRSSRDAKVTE